MTRSPASSEPANQRLGESVRYVAYVFNAGGSARRVDLLAAIERLRPDVVVVDLNMPSLSGIEARRRVRATTPSVKVIILTADDDPEMKERAFQLGASGIVVKMRASDDLLPAIQDALAGTPPSTRHRAV